MGKLVSLHAVSLKVAVSKNLLEALNTSCASYFHSAPETPYVLPHYVAFEIAQFSESEK